MSRAAGTFAGKVLAAVRRIPPGRVATYGDIAALAGSPLAHRAVGTVMRECRDPGVPCHRVIAAGGALGGYGSFLQLKRDLLRAEGLEVTTTRVRRFDAVRWPGQHATSGRRPGRRALCTVLLMLAWPPASDAQSPAQARTSARAALLAAHGNARTLLADGQTPSVPAAAFEMRDAALAIEASLATVPAEARLRVAGALRTIVLAAWRLEAASDAGDLAQVEHAFTGLSGAVATIDAALPDTPPPAPGSVTAPAPALAPALAGGPAIPTYADQVRPIFQERCAHCHDDRGAAVRLLDHASAAQAAPAIKTQVLHEVMPPWFVDPEGPPVAGTRTMSAREIDTLLRWSSHGAPDGSREARAAGRTPTAAWIGGSPSHVLHAQPVTVQPGQPGSRTRLTVATGLTEDLWIRSADVLLSEPALVRAALVRLAGGPVLRTWFPGEPLTDTPAGTAFRIPAGATLEVELLSGALPVGGAPRTVAAQIGLYTTSAPASGRGLTTQTFDDTLTLGDAARVVAVRIIQTEPLDTVDVVATAPDGRSLPLLRLRASHPGWDRRYWLANPVALQAGTSLSVHVSGENPTVEVLLDTRAAP